MARVRCRLGNKISKVYTALVIRMYMEGSRHGVRTSLRGGEESKVLEVPGADCGLGHRHQQGIYSNCKTYVHGRGVVTGSERACEEGEESKVQETPRADYGLGNGYQQSTYSICKNVLTWRGVDTGS
jgi:hypothetical protein